MKQIQIYNHKISRLDFISKANMHFTSIISLVILSTLVSGHADAFAESNYEDLIHARSAYPEPSYHKDDLWARHAYPEPDYDDDFLYARDAYPYAEPEAFYTDASLYARKLDLSGLLHAQELYRQWEGGPIDPPTGIKKHDAPSHKKIKPRPSA